MKDGDFLAQLGAKLGLKPRDQVAFAQVLEKEDIDHITDLELLATSRTWTPNLETLTELGKVRVGMFLDQCRPTATTPTKAGSQSLGPTSLRPADFSDPRSELDRGDRSLTAIALMRPMSSKTATRSRN